ncbi:hypothetical protein WR25_19597 [Diploscapter pachys]|uniref:Heparan-alpha-glucosaminide N-acetyltransferase catalytic domain-containing protein n=1 Tax=Diploscapter pachys TaxID=2018661 RepID=A0A2A2KGY8_9BILA|nr:hypothetical protein WR25_19597 [Diploscapter pachys]
MRVAGALGAVGAGSLRGRVGEHLRLRTSYPLLPWIGVIALGYGLGPWFARGSDADKRQQRLLWAGVALLLGFGALRLLNGYGEAPWSLYASVGQTLMSFFNITKYPPSLLFLALTLGVGLVLLRGFERAGDARWIGPLAVFGAAPMFFYLLHLYVLKLLAAISVSMAWARYG